MNVIPAKTNALNIGSGPLIQSNQTFLWVDATAWPIDIAADIRVLPFKDGSFSHICCSHLVEHVPLPDVVPALKEIRRVLNRSGILYISAPDMDRARGAGSREWVQFTAKGGFRAGWEHMWSCTVIKLRKILIEAGFVPTWAKAVPTGYPPNTHGWPLEFESRFLCRRDDFQWPRFFPTGMEVIW